MTFDVGFSGELDFTEMIATGPIFAPLRDEAYFQTVAVQEHGRSFGWNLDEPGHEIDLCPDATRIRLETPVVEELARRWRARRSAAE
ncbi:MAG TPA: molybdopterin-guanine dinucleotide biosynthesis protein [Beijerinckiaceae bacterium]|nr:molybdopterin-guanine dinucleotide biosynthesis protein [Beijerinckiaceae bacterium]